MEIFFLLNAQLGPDFYLMNTQVTDSHKVKIFSWWECSLIRYGSMRLSIVIMYRKESGILTAFYEKSSGMLNRKLKKVVQ